MSMRGMAPANPSHDPEAALSGGIDALKDWLAFGKERETAVASVLATMKARESSNRDHRIRSVDDAAHGRMSTALEALRRASGDAQRAVDTLAQEAEYISPRCAGVQPLSGLDPTPEGENDDTAELESQPGVYANAPAMTLDLQTNTGSAANKGGGPVIATRQGFQTSPAGLVGPCGDRDSYVEMAPLAFGLFGVVQLVRRKADSLVFAMKVMSKSRITKMKQLKNIRNEKELLTEVHHPFLVGVEECFQDSVNVYLVLEYCHGGDLAGLINQFDNAVLPLRHARFYTACIVSAFEYLHNRCILYRDLKAENVVIDKQGYIKLTDFGFAIKVQTLEGASDHSGRDRAMSFVGTLHALPPELVMQTGQNKAGDWWGLGILLHELLAGRPPFEVPDSAPDRELYAKIIDGITEDHQWPSTLVNTPAQDLISKLLITDWSKRLGNNSAYDVQAHPFYSDGAHGDAIDFRMLAQRQLQPPWVPEIEDDDDISYFDEPNVEESYNDRETGREVVVNPDDFRDW